MTLQKNIFYTKSLYIFIFLILHLALFNINKVEWGDSYRILSAAESFRYTGEYPSDEKRPPLLSAVIAVFLNPSGSRGDESPVLVGKAVLFLFSFLSFIQFIYLTELLIKNAFYRRLAWMFFIFNPIILYWSLRIYADVPFMFFVLTAAVLYEKWLKNPGGEFYPLLIGLTSGMAALLRFEGYILFTAGIAGVLFYKKFKNLREFGLSILVYTVSFSLVMLPYIYYKNPLNSSYFNEPSSRIYDLKMVVIFIISLLFSLGVFGAVCFVIKSFRKVQAILIQNSMLAVYLALSLLLILFWPAAIPRLFVPVIPFFIIFFVLGLEDYYSGNYSAKTAALCNLSILVIFVISQYSLKLQFLMVIQYIFVISVLSGVLSIVFLYYKKSLSFSLTVLFIMVLWTFSTLYIHSSLYYTLAEAGRYTKNINSPLYIHNDTSGVFEWYSMHNSDNPAVIYQYQSNLFEKKENLPPEYYIICTNEHNPYLKPADENSAKYRRIMEFRNHANGRDFFTIIYEVEQIAGEL